MHGGGIEATIGAGDGLFSGNVIRSSDATMWRDRAGWGGSSLARRDCIRLQGFNGHSTTEFLVTPRGASIEDVWQALLTVGVKPGGPEDA